MASITEEESSVRICEGEEDDGYQSKETHLEGSFSEKTAPLPPHLSRTDVPLTDNEPSDPEKTVGPDCESFVYISLNLQSLLEADSGMSEDVHREVNADQCSVVALGSDDTSEMVPADHCLQNTRDLEENTEEIRVSVQSMIQKFELKPKLPAPQVPAESSIKLPSSLTTPDSQKCCEESSLFGDDDQQEGETDNPISEETHSQTEGNDEDPGLCSGMPDADSCAEREDERPRGDEGFQNMMKNEADKSTDITPEGKDYETATEGETEENEADMHLQVNCQSSSGGSYQQSPVEAWFDASAETVRETHGQGENDVEDCNSEPVDDTQHEDGLSDPLNRLSPPRYFSSPSLGKKDEEVSVLSDTVPIFGNLRFESTCSDPFSPEVRLQKNLPETREHEPGVANPVRICGSERRERDSENPSAFKPVPSHRRSLQNQPHLTATKQSLSLEQHTDQHCLPQECKDDNTKHQPSQLLPAGLQQLQQPSPVRGQTASQAHLTGFPRDLTTAATCSQPGAPERIGAQARFTKSPLPTQSEVTDPDHTKTTDDCPTTVRVDGVDETVALDLISLYFESRKAGGGDISGIEDFRNQGYVLITFEDPAVAERVTGHTHTVAKRSVTVTMHKVESLLKDSPEECCTVKVHGQGVSEDELLQLYFENPKRSGGGPIENIQVDEKFCIAIITFKDAKDAAEVLTRSHTLMGKSLSVTPYRPSRTVKVSNLKKNASEDLLEMYFESHKGGGHEVEKVVLFSEKGEALVTFREGSAVQSVMQKGHTVGGAKVTISLHEGITQALAPEAKQTSKETVIVQVRGLSEKTSEETVQFYFENKRRSGGGPIQDIKADLGSRTALITFEDSEAVKRVLEKKHEIDGKEIQVTVYTPSEERDDSSDDREDHSELSCVVVKGLDKSTSEDMLSMYFENKRRSGGGPIADVRFDERKGVVYVTFKQATDALNVASRQHKLQGKDLTVQLYRPPEMMKDRVVLSGFEDVKSSDELWNFVEAKTRESVTSILFGDDGGTAVVVFEDAIDLQKVQSALTKKLFKTTRLIVEPVPVSKTVLVRNLPQNPAPSEDMLTNYFESKRRSGGGDVVEVEVGGDGKYALVTFADTKDAESVTKRQHRIHEHQVDVTLFCEGLGVNGGDPEPAVKIPEPITLSESAQLKISALNIAPHLMKKFNTLLQEHHASLSKSGPSEQFCLTCALTPEIEGIRQLAKSWEQDVVGVVELYMRNILVEELNISEEVHGEVAERLKEICEQAEMGLSFDRHTDILSVIWDGDEKKKEIIEKIMRMIQETEDSVKRKHEVKTEQMKIAKGKLLLLKTHVTNTEERFSDLSVKFDLENDCIAFTGVREDITGMKLIINEFMTNITSHVHTWDSELASRLLTFPKARETLEMECLCHDQDGAVVIVPNGFEVHSFDERLCEKMLLAGRNAVQRRVVKLDDSMADIIAMEGWKSVKNLLLEANKDLMLMDESEMGLTVVSLTKNINKDIVQLKSFLDDNTIQEDTLTMAKPFKSLFREYFWKQFEIKRQGKSLRLETIVLDEDDDKIVVKGNPLAIQEAKCIVASFVRSLKSTEKTFRKPLLDRFLDSGEWKLAREEIEQKLMCKILPPTESFECFFTREESDFKRFGEMRHFHDDDDDDDDDGNDVIQVPSTYGNPQPAVLSRGVTGRRSFGNTKPQTDIKVKVATWPNVIKPAKPRIYLSIMSDITKEEHDVLVNSAAASLQLNSGQVSAALLKVGGEVIQMECTQKYPNGIQPGELAVTSGGKLFCKNIFHCCLPEKKDDQQMKDILTTIVMTCLSEADTRGYRSVGFPALGTGNLSYPSELVAETMFQATMDYGLKNPQCKLSDVFFILHKKDEANKKAFEDENEKWKQDPTEEQALSEEEEVNPDAKGIKRWPFFNETARKVKLIFVTQDAGTMHKAEQELMDQYKKMITVSKFAVPEVEKWHQDHINDLVNSCKSVDVNLTINYDFERLELEGLREKVDRVHVSKVIKEAGDRIQEEKLAHLLAKQIKWYFVEITLADEELMEYDIRTSYRLEKAYKEGNLRVFILDQNKQAFVVDFTKMEEMPENPILAADASPVKVVRKNLIQDMLLDAPLPDTWSKMKGELDVVQVKPGSQEYERVAATFRTTCSQMQEIVKIERVQNATLYKQYMALRQQMLKSCKKPEIEDLWHGTNEDAAQSIIKHGFNRSYCNLNMCAYGQGVYFARGADYSSRDQYAQADSSGVRNIFQCRVLVGQYAKGDKEMRVPPLITSTDGRHYDSTVDDDNEPTIFAAYSDVQAYPDYLIRFK